MSSFRKIKGNGAWVKILGVTTQFSLQNPFVEEKIPFYEKLRQT